MNKSSFEYIYCDLSNEESIENTWKTLIQKYREIHILINNAAIARGLLFSNLDYYEHYKNTIQINFLSYVHFSKLFCSQKCI